MKRLNNKGFAISTILFSVLIVFLSVLAVSYATLASNPDKKDEKCPEGCNNDKCICPKPPEESIGCDSFRDFSCPNEFSIGTEKFCLLYTENNTAVALAKYPVNTGPYKSDKGPDGLQFKYSECYGVYVDSVGDGTPSDISARSGKYGIYELINKKNSNNTTNTRVKTRITTPATFTATKPNGTGETSVIRYDSIKSLSDIGDNSSSCNNCASKFVEQYHTKLDSIINDSSKSIVVRMINLRDLDSEYNSTKNFNCSTDPSDYSGSYAVHDFAYDTGGYGGGVYFDCNVSNDKKWIFSTSYAIDVVNINGAVPLSAFYVSENYSIVKIGASAVEERLYYFRPVIELDLNYYNQLKSN